MIKDTSNDYTYYVCYLPDQERHRISYEKDSDEGIAIVHPIKLNNFSPSHDEIEYRIEHIALLLMNPQDKPCGMLLRENDQLEFGKYFGFLIKTSLQSGYDNGLPRNFSNYIPLRPTKNKIPFRALSDDKINKLKLIGRLIYREFSENPVGIEANKRGKFCVTYFPPSNFPEISRATDEFILNDRASQIKIRKPTNAAPTRRPIPTPTSTTTPRITTPKQTAIPTPTSIPRPLPTPKSTSTTTTNTTSTTTTTTSSPQKIPDSISTRTEEPKTSSSAVVNPPPYKVTKRQKIKALFRK